MGFVGNLLLDALPTVLALAKQLADSQVKGEDLTKDYKQGLYLAYVAIKVYGDDLVESTANPYDDQVLAEVADFAKDTLAEAGIIVPEIPDDVLEAQPEPKVAKKSKK